MNDSILTAFLLIEAHALFRFLQSYLKLFSCCRIQCRTVYYILSCLLRLLLALIASWTILIFYDLISCEKYFVECLSFGVRLFFFSWLNWDCAFWGRKITERMCCSHHIILGVHAITLICYCWQWPWASGWGSVCQLSPLPQPLPAVFSARSHCAQPTLKGVRVIFHLLEGRLSIQIF